MAKTVRWQVPFVSIGGTQYRVDIYDEGEYTPVQLVAGETPFTTDEDGSDDFFAPVRSQTGTLQVCTKTASGSTITLDDLLPENNIARPVRLISIANNVETIEWQGFLSCEAYSQEYTGVPQVIDLPVISVLEAMDSIEVDIREDMAFKLLIAHISYALYSMEEKSGMTLFNKVYMSNYCSTAILNKFIYNNTYFEAKEQISGDNIVVEVHSISCKKILEQIAKFFGCCWRESGQDLYLYDGGLYDSYIHYNGDYLIGRYVTGDEPDESGIGSSAVQSGDIADMTWMGDGHQRTVSQGARRVTVTSKLEGFEGQMALEETPVNNLVENPEERQPTNGEVHVNTNETFYSLAEHKHYRVKAIFPTDLSGASLTLAATLSSINYANTIFWANNDFRTYYETLVVNQTQGSNSGINFYITSFMCWWRDLENELRSGLMICGVPKRLLWSYSPIQGRTWNKYDLTASNYLFKQKTALNFAASTGFIKVNIETLAWSNAPGTMPSIVYGATYYPTLTVAIQFGNKWATLNSSTGKYEWTNSFTTIDFPLEHKTTNEVLKTLGNWDSSMNVNQEDGIYIPIPSFMTGFVSVRVYHEVNAMCEDGGYTNSMFDVLITKLDVDYVKPDEELRTDRSENIYSEATDQAFKDELSVDVELASDANNTKQATMLWDSSDQVTKLLSLGYETIRPEVALLNRLKDYYSAARQKLELEVAHLSTPLPLLRLNGINDSKVYAPVAESRDWQMETSTLTCMEKPQS